MLAEAFSKRRTSVHKEKNARKEVHVLQPPIVVINADATVRKHLALVGGQPATVLFHRSRR
eukprot:COSAG02_NODE_58500_length_277_cov_0.584270_2_plen_60_part_01